MPRKTVTAFLMEVTLIFLMISVIGHLTVNFWERHFVTTELAQMKNSLYALKHTLYNICIAYDTLQVDIKSLSDKSTKLKSEAEYNNICKNTLDRRRLHDINVNAVINAKKRYQADLKKEEGFNFWSKNKVSRKPDASTPLNYAANEKTMKHEKDKHNLMLNTDPIKTKECGAETTRIESPAVIITQTPANNIATMTRYKLKNSAAGDSNTEINKPRHVNTLVY